MRPIWLLPLLACGLLASTAVHAQGYQVIPTCGTAAPPAGNSQGYMDSTGLVCSSASVTGSVTSSTTATASAAPTPVVAGTGKPLNISLFSGMFVELGVGGNLVPAGHGVAATALRVELPTDGTGVVGLNAGSAIIGNVRIDQTTPGTTNNVTATPIPAASTQISSTIATGGSFQTALAGSATRKGCTLQNTSTHTMSVYVGILGTATTGLSFQVPAGGFFYCGNAGVVVNDAINITTSTTADTYVIASQ